MEVFQSSEIVKMDAPVRTHQNLTKNVMCYHKAVKNIKKQLHNTFYSEKLNNIFPPNMAGIVYFPKHKGLLLALIM